MSKEKESLELLTSKPFDLKNKEQLAALNQYINHFEDSANQMYLYQSKMTEWENFWMIVATLSLSEFADSLLPFFLYCGITDTILEKFNVTDFYEQLEEMKLIYNWCLKNNEPVYNGITNNNELLANVDIQRFIKLIAPFCTTDFIIVWPKVSVQEKSTKPVLHFFSTAYSFFTPVTTGIDNNRLNDLKIKVEHRKLDVNVLNGIERAINYFTSTLQFNAKIHQPLEGQSSTMINSFSLF